MPSNKLIGINGSQETYKAEIAARYSNQKFDLSDGLPTSPLDKAPVLETSEGSLFGGNAIAYYFSNQQLRGTTDLHRAQVIQWLEFADREIVPSLSWVQAALNLAKLDQVTVDSGKETLKKALDALNSVLLTRTWLVGERVTLADIVVGSSLLEAYQGVLEPSIRSAYPNVNRWFLTFVNQPEVKAIVGEVKLNEKEGVTTKTAADSKKGKKADKTDDAGDLDEDEPVEKPSADPFNVLPKGNWNMEDFKRFYSNNPEDKAIEYFWQKFDKENFSIWYGEYKYPEELTMVFMSCNLMSGMMQRLERMRKNAFGSLCLFGEDGNSQISQLWVWRGHDLAFELSPDWSVDYSSYEWTKLDNDSEETKKLVHEYFMQSEDWVRHGKKFNQGKIFK